MTFIEKIDGNPIFYSDINQRSQEWFDIRKGVVTGSTISDATGGPKAQATLAYKKISEKYVDESVLPKGYQFENVALQEKILEGLPLTAGDVLKRGSELEYYVQNLYTKKTGHEVQEVGFVKINQFLGCSPDGIITSGKKCIGVLEMKCPLGPNFIRYLSEGGIPKIYQGQAINYFLCIPDLEFVDFAIYHPGADNRLGQLHVRKMTRENFSDVIKKWEDKFVKYANTMDEIEKDLFLKYNTLGKNKDGK